MVTADGDYLIDRLDIQILTSARDLIPSERRPAEGEYVIVAGPDYDSTNETDAAEISLVTANQALRSQSLRGAGSGLRGLNFLPFQELSARGNSLQPRWRVKMSIKRSSIGRRLRSRWSMNCKFHPRCCISRPMVSSCSPTRIYGVDYSVCSGRRIIDPSTWGQPSASSWLSVRRHQ